MRLNGQYIPIDPRSWNSSMDVTVNVGIGMGKDEMKLASLNQALQMQMQIYQGYGASNGLVTLTQIRNTLGDILALGGIRNADRYFNPLTPEMEQALIQQQMQNAQQPTPEQMIAQAQVEAASVTAQAKAQSDLMKMEIDAQKALAQDDRERDKMDQELLLKAVEILGKYGTSVDVERIKQMQKSPRYPDQTPTEAVVGGRY